MPATVTIRVEGLSKLGQRLEKLKSDVALKIARSATNAAAQLVKKQAITNVITSPSVDTGSLRDAIVVKRPRKSEMVFTSEHLVTVRRRLTSKQKLKGKQRTAPHAWFVEYGTVHMAAEPFLRPALEVRKHDAIDAMKDKLESGIIKAGG